MNKALEKIGNMVGHTYTFKREEYEIKGFIPEESTVRIKTNREDIVLLYDGLGHQLSFFTETHESELNTSLAVVQKSEVQSAIGSLSSILQENIRKVQESKDYIPQAESVNASVKTMIDLAKAEIEYRKTEMEIVKLRLGR